jgi:magnesium transporter
VSADRPNSRPNTGPQRAVERAVGGGVARARRLLRRPAPPGPAFRSPDGAGANERGIDEVIGDCGVYEDGHRRPGRVPLDQAARAAAETTGFVWIGLQQPTVEDIAVVAEEFSLPELAVEDAVVAHQRPKLEVYGDIVFMVLKPVRYVDHDEVVDVTELALFVGTNYVVTVRHGEGEALGRVRAELDTGDTDLLAHGPTGVLYRAADLVVDGYEDAIASITEDIDEIESQVFGGDADEDHAQRIYKLKREVAEFRRAVLPLAAPLARLAEGAVPGLDASTAPYFRDVHDHALRAADAIEGHDRLLSDVLQANVARVGVRQSKIAVRQNEDMRRISAWAAIALVPTAIAGIYGMNFDHMPELGWDYGYFVVLAVIAIICGSLYRLFRRSGWL